MAPNFATVLDHALDEAPRHAVQPDGPAPDLMLGLSAGIWRAYLPVDEFGASPDSAGSALATRPRKTRRGRAPRLRSYGTLPVRRPADNATAGPDSETPRAVSGRPRWTFAQLDALDVLRTLGAELEHHPDPKAVKRAWWTLARDLHPDHNLEDPAGAHARFCRLQAAWEVLRSGPQPAVSQEFTPLW